MSLALGWTQQIGLPNLLVYFLTGSFADSIERALHGLPSHILLTKIIPKGLEATMLTMTSAILVLNGIAIR